MPALGSLYICPLNEVVHCTLFLVHKHQSVVIWSPQSNSTSSSVSDMPSSSMGVLSMSSPVLVPQVGVLGVQSEQMAASLVAIAVLLSIALHVNLIFSLVLAG